MPLQVDVQESTCRAVAEEDAVADQCIAQGGQTHLDAQRLYTLVLVKSMKLATVDEEPVLQQLVAPQRVSQRPGVEALMPAPALRPACGVQVDIVRLT